MQKRHLTKYPFIIKILRKTEKERNFLNLIKSIYKKQNPTANVILNGERLNKAKMSTLTTLFKIVLEVLATTIKQEREIKDIPARKEKRMM